MIMENNRISYTTVGDFTFDYNVTTLENDTARNTMSWNYTTDKVTGDQADDAIWILTSTFIIFTMQSGFGLLESGSVTSKNEVNIMVKNAADVIFGGLTYWMFGYGFSFGDKQLSNPFCGWGHFFVTAEDSDLGEVYSKFFFQASFATTATTIVSGAMAERTKFEAYIIFSLFNTLVFCFPAHWMWGKNGWLKELGAIDIAGAGPVHMVGGMTGLVATLMLKPRYGRYRSRHPPPMGAPTNAILGMFMLWWGWLGFNCGSTFGISGFKWKLAARSAVATLSSSVAGGTVGIGTRSAVSTFTAVVGGGTLAFLSSYIFKKRKFEVSFMINGILSSLVAVTGMCALAQPWEGMVVGTVGSLVSLSAITVLDKLKIDDPVGCVAVHGIGGIWSLLSVGLFARDQDTLRESIGIKHNYFGLLRGGGPYLLGVQTLAIVSMVGWTGVTAFILLKTVDLTVGLRMRLQHEILGADLVEHAVGSIEYDKRTNRVTNMNQTKMFQDGTVEEIWKPQFNENRKKRHLSLEQSSIQTATEFMQQNGFSTHHHPQQYKLVSGSLKEKNDSALAMWKFGVTKCLNPDQVERRKRARKWIKVLSTRRGELQLKQNSNSLSKEEQPPRKDLSVSQQTYAHEMDKGVCKEEAAGNRNASSNNLPSYSNPAFLYDSAADSSRYLSQFCTVDIASQSMSWQLTAKQVSNVTDKPENDCVHLRSNIGRYADVDPSIIQRNSSCQKDLDPQAIAIYI